MPYIQMKAGHSQSQITERYIHAAQIHFPGAAAKGEARLFATTPLTRDDAQPPANGPRADPAHGTT